MSQRQRALFLAVGLVACAVMIPHASLGQSAGLVLCDRVAADPADPDKPADVRGVREIEPSDIATAIKFCRTASGAARRAMYQLGRAYAANRQMPEAIAAWRKAADKGSTSAMVELGVMYATGAGVPADQAQARALLERAAEAGNPRAVANLAVLAAQGGGAAPADPVKTRALLTRATDSNAEAQYQLAMMLADGAGGPKDDAGARALFEKAAAQGHTGALVQMGAFAQSGRGGPQDSAAARAYLEKAAAQGDEQAKAALKRSECSWVIKDKRGNVVTHLCF
jgi:TPR repeat protein